MKHNFRLIGAMLTMVYLLFISLSCSEDPIPMDNGDLTDIPFNPQPYTLILPDHLPSLSIPADNPLTVEGIELGRHLFYDPILSADSTMSCFSCHFQVGSFTDNLKVSTGIDGNAGRRSSMSLLNVGLYDNGLFWDGRVLSLEEQAILPVEDPVELFDSWENVEARLMTHKDYPEMFRKAFGIERVQEIDRDLATKALAQFERIMVSYNSKFDRFLQNETVLNDMEFLGFQLYIDEDPDIPDAECAHCHSLPLGTSNDYFNNGLDAVTSLDDFEDKGRGEVTMASIDNGKFRAPTLRNIFLTAPYMHDGRFATIDEVLEHYNSGGHPSPNKDPLIKPLGLSNFELEALKAFLHTLTDTSFINNPALSNPFE